MDHTAHSREARVGCNILNRMTEFGRLNPTAGCRERGVGNTTVFSLVCFVRRVYRDANPQFSEVAPYKSLVPIRDLFIYS